MAVRLLVAAALVVLLGRAGPTAAQAACQAGDVAALRECIRVAPQAGPIRLTRDIACSFVAECCPGGAATLRIAGVRGLEIDGQGHALRRTAGQKACAALVVRDAPGLSIARLTFDEDSAAPPCELADKGCPSTLDIASTTKLTLDGVRVLWGKGYVVKLWNASDIAIRGTEIADAGIIGLYAGHYRYGATSRLVIENSRFLRARANGVALQGVDDAIIRASRFEGNHWHGLWPVPNVPGGITTGGQLLLAQGTGMRVEGNIFQGAACGNCRPSPVVTAIEVGEGPEGPGVAGLSITGNRICNVEPGMAIYHNPGAPARTASVAGNRVSGYTGIDNLRGAVARSGNILAHEDRCPVS